MVGNWSVYVYISSSQSGRRDQMGDWISLDKLGQALSDWLSSLGMGGAGYARKACPLVVHAAVM